MKEIIIVELKIIFSNPKTFSFDKLIFKTKPKHNTWEVRGAG